MGVDLLLTNASVVAATEVFRGTVWCESGRIQAVDRGLSMLPRAMDLNGDFLLPGLVELHTDNLEKHFVPRPGVSWPPLSAMIAHDAQVVSSGITTVFDALCLGELMHGPNRLCNLADMVEAVTDASHRGLTRAQHFLHLRCELSHAEVLDLLHPLIDHPLVRLVSLMDHSPGQRQFTSLAKYREYYGGKLGLSESALEAFIDRQRETSTRYSASHRCRIVESCRQRRLPMASHDDATQEHVQEAASLGMRIAEFPTTLQAARAARAHGLAILMGAPNVVRGVSHSGNISARMLAGQDLLDMLSSDYLPASLMQAAFLLHERVAGVSLPEAIAKVTLNPARAAGFEDRGEIETGKRADLVRVRRNDGLPLIEMVWQSAIRVF